MRNNKLINKKLVLDAEMMMLNNMLTDLENKIAVYSTIDMVRVAQLVATKTELEKYFLDVLTESNTLWLQSIVETSKVAVKASKTA